MEILTKQGYKQTEVGLIPEDWNLHQIVDLIDLLTDYDANGSFASVAENVNVYDYEKFAWYVRSTDLEKKSNLADVRYVDRESYQFLKKTSLYGGELLFLKRGDIGNVYLFKMKTKYATLAPNLYLLKLNEVSNSSYLYYYFVSSKGQSQLKSKNASSTLGALYKDDVKAIYVPLPPTLTEQKTIATALSDVDALIASLEQTITKKKAIKQGAMQQLLTPPHKGGKRLPGFSGEWMEKTLGECTELITKGTTPTSLGKPFTSEGINFIKAESIDKTGNIINEKVAHIDLETHDLLGRSKMKNKDLLFTIAGVLGRIGIIREENLPANTNQAVAIIRLKKSLGLSVSFFFHVLRTKTIEKHIEAISVQGAQANFSLTDVNNIPLTLPAYIEEQKAIAQILSDMDAEITQLETKKEKYQAIKQGMMQELLTGKTRLV